MKVDLFEECDLSLLYLKSLEFEVNEFYCGTAF